MNFHPGQWVRQTLSESEQRGNTLPNIGLVTEFESYTTNSPLSFNDTNFRIKDIDYRKHKDIMIDVEDANDSHYRYTLWKPTEDEQVLVSIEGEEWDIRYLNDETFDKYNFCLPLVAINFIGMHIKKLFDLNPNMLKVI